jgi:hypothetical protein
MLNCSISLRIPITEHVAQVRGDMERVLEWALLEIHHWRQEAEELQTQLMLIEGEFTIDEEIIKPKRRTMF